MVAFANFTILATNKHVDCFTDKKKEMFRVLMTRAQNYRSFTLKVHPMPEVKISMYLLFTYFLVNL